MTPPRPDPSAHQHSHQAGEEIARARQRTVRLVVSIPALLCLLAIAGGALIRFNLLSAAEVLRGTPAQYTAFETAADYLLLYSAIMALLSALIGLLLALQIVRPLRRIEESMAAVARGELPPPPATGALGEVEMLSSTFGKMVNQLEVVFRERDRQIREAGSKARLMLDPRGIVITADGTLRRVLRIDPSEVIGRSLIKLSPHERLASIAPLADVLSGMIEEAKPGVTPERQVLIPHSAGDLLVAVSLNAFYAGHGGVDQYLVELRDISGMKHFFEQLQRADRLAAIGTLSTGIAHEIRNPLASIKGMVQLMAEQSRTGSELVPPEEYHRRITSEVERLERLVAAIMAFARGESAPPEPVQLNRLIEDVVVAARPAAGESADKVPLTIELDPSLPEVVVQGGRLRQALLNLARNAFEHCAEHGGAVRVSSLYLPVNEMRPVIICVANTCECIDRERIDKMFEPFFTTKAKGTGLGLPIAYQTVQSNGGILDVEHEDGELKFWIKLPLDARPQSIRDYFPNPATPTTAELAQASRKAP